MKSKTIYFCDNCNKEFENKSDCEFHEHTCCDKTSKYEENIKNVIELAKIKFDNLITSTKYTVDFENIMCEDLPHIIYKFEIIFQLSNGNIVNIYDGMDDNLWLGNYLETDKIYESVEREILSHMSTSFEGIINWFYDDGWRKDVLGDIER
jgi:hypothetical protein